MIGEAELIRIEFNVKERWCATKSEANSLIDEVRRLRGAINRYCETRNTHGIEDHTPYGEAIDELYRLSRESGFRPRIRANSEVER